MDLGPDDPPARQPVASTRRQFADGRQFARIRALSIVDERSRTSIRELLQEVADLTGFRVAALNRVREDRHLQMVVAVGTEMTDAEMEQLSVPVEVWSEALGRTARWGNWRYTHAADCPAEILDYSWVPDLSPTTSPDDWDPLSALEYPILDESGNLVASLAVDVPVDGKVPLPERHALLDGIGRIAAHSILAIIEREHQAERARIAEAARAARDTIAAGEDHASDILDRVCRALEEGLGADQVEVSWLDPSLVNLRGTTNQLSTADRDHVLQAWRTQGVEQLEDGTSPPGRPGHLRVPVASEHQCYGALMLKRTTIRAPWTQTEIRGVRQIAAGLGAAIAAQLLRESERRLVEELRSAAADNSLLAATLSHDLASPLNAIRNYLDLLEMTTSDPDHHRRVIEALRAGTSQVADTADLLQLLHSAPGGSRSPAAVEVVQLVRDVVHLHTDHARRHRIVLDLEVTADSAMVDGFRADLVRVVANLLSNALKYTDPGGTIQVTVGVEADHVFVCCADTGIGMAPDQSERVFELHYRADDPRVALLPGTGLGLPIVAKLVEEHGGEVVVTSELGIGTEVTVRLPLRRTSPSG